MFYAFENFYGIVSANEGAKEGLVEQVWVTVLKIMLTLDAILEYYYYFSYKPYTP